MTLGNAVSMGAATSVAEERRLVECIAATPGNRKVFVDTAAYFDAIGDIETASSLYNGVVPEWLIEKYDLAVYQSKNSKFLDSCESIGWYPPHTEKLTPTVNKDSNRNAVFIKDAKGCPPEFLDVLSNGSLVYDGVNRLYVDQTNTRVSNHSDINSYLCHRLAGDISSTTEVLPGYSILLAARNASNFYHWHFDILPVLGMAEECGVKISDIDQIILTEKESSFHLAMLQALGVRESQIRIIKPGYQHIRCEKLLLPTIRNSMGRRQPRKHIDWLRSKFLDIGSVQESDQNSRKVAIMRDQRGYADNALVESFFTRRGYRIFRPEQHSYQEQVRVFHQASHIVSPHGAGLSLLAYCKPGTIVHEFYGEHIHPCFWYISATLGLKYYNYNCCSIKDASVTRSGRGMEERLKKTINVTAEVLDTLGDI